MVRGVRSCSNKRSLLCASATTSGSTAVAAHASRSCWPTQTMPRLKVSLFARIPLSTEVTACCTTVWQACKALLCGSATMPSSAQTIGRFGKGALTAYSLSDIIQVISGDDMLVLDPHGTHLPAQLQSVFGNLVSLKDDKFGNVAKECPGQMHPFQSFTNKCSDVPTFVLRHHYPGTLFRLALRSQRAACRSEISSESFTKDKILQTLHSFIQAAPDLLLFTRHVKAISVYLEHTADGACELLHECRAGRK